MRKVTEDVALACIEIPEIPTLLYERKQHKQDPCN